jgi:phosphate transport system permease protein
MKTDRICIALTAAALGSVLLMLFTLVIVVIINGISTFWPSDVAVAKLNNGKVIMGELVGQDTSAQKPTEQRLQFKIGNRDLYGLDFTWIEEKELSEELSYPESVTVFERMEYGNFYAIDVKEEGQHLLLTAIDGKTVTLEHHEVVRRYQPNTMGIGAKFYYYGKRIRELLFDNPREANTEGGLFPSIFGTILLVFVMSIASFPFGVIAGVYMKEYAKDGYLLRAVRIAVNNLAGIPSIVFGIFGLGFFIYGVGRNIDLLFFADSLPNPTFGTGGLLWASLTLGLLTVPVVIVSTEEALSVIPKGVRESSLALGASQFQTLVRVLLPMASPGILTGFILAMTRAAGEVAPLMLTGVVKLAPALPLDGSFPFIHFDRKFMHLGFHIYDIGFQSPNVEAAKPMVFVTTLLLLAIVITMTSSAVMLRNRMKKKFTTAHI